MSDDRASMVHERATVGEGRFAAMLRALESVQSHSADARSVAYAQRSSGGVCEVTATERAIDAGAVGRGRTSWSRIAATSGEGRRALAWLVDYARVGDLESLAVLYAQHAAPVEMLARRDVAAAAVPEVAEAAALAKNAHAAAKRIAMSRAVEAITALIAAKAAADHAAGRLASAHAAVARVEGELRAWGLAAMGAAVEAWEDAGEGWLR